MCKIELISFLFKWMKIIQTCHHIVARMHTMFGSFQFVVNFDKIQWTTYLVDISVMVRINTLLITYQYYNYNGEKIMNCTRKFKIFLTYKFMKKYWLQPIQKLCAIANPNWIVIRMGHTTMDHARCKDIFPLGCCDHIFCFSTLAFHYICLTSLLITH
jgi:hypothetical protein